MPEARSFDQYLIAVLDALDRSNARYALIGGLAQNAYARPRATKDVDVLLDVPAVGLPGVLEALKDAGAAVDVQQHIRDFSQNQMAFLISPDGRLDLLKPVLPVHKRIVQQARSMMFEGRPARVARPEHLVVLKTLAGRDGDWKDIEDLVAVVGPDLDTGLALREIADVLPAGDPRRARLESLIGKR